MFNFSLKQKEKPSIQSEILLDFRNAKKSIKIAVSWFTDDKLFDELIRQAKSNIDIQIILSADDWNLIEYERIQEIQKHGGLVHKIGAKTVESATSDNLFMHGKFYIIDDSLAKSGSYNFSKNAAVKQFNKWNKISDGSDFKHTIEEFEEIRSQSVDFFKDISNPEEIRSQLAHLENKGVTPDQRKTVQNTSRVLFDNGEVKNKHTVVDPPKQANYTMLMSNIIGNAIDTQPIVQNAQGILSAKGAKTAALVAPEVAKISYKDWSVMGQGASSDSTLLQLGYELKPETSGEIYDAFYSAMKAGKLTVKRLFVKTVAAGKSTDGRDYNGYSTFCVTLAGSVNNAKGTAQTIKIDLSIKAAKPITSSLEATEYQNSVYEAVEVGEAFDFASFEDTFKVWISNDPASVVKSSLSTSI